MAVRKQVRLNPSGRIVDADRQIHVSQEDGGGDAHKVEFRHVGGAVRDHTIDFGTASPFTGSPTFDVPAGGKTLKDVDKDKLPGVYKYRVIDKASGDETDDPDVIVD